ncbi:TetR/AcrR family transcriptional regulator [Spongiimicrobium salis]|uniref:TetR/AcrR family transcriptional regulator n=1 Tax=Spongiimicrobium salis TaxID=1667022 RepID=UPI00374DCCCD
MGRPKKYNREEVLQKAVHVFWEHGYENTSVRMLEERLGINQKSLYAEFSNKERLFLEVLKHYQLFHGKNILAPLLQSEGNLEDIRTFFNDFVKNAKSGTLPNGCLLANTMMEFGSSNTNVKTELEGYYQLIYGAFFKMLTKAKEKGNLGIEADVSKLANYLFGCTEGLMVIVKVLDNKALSAYIEVIMKSII